MNAIPHGFLLFTYLPPGPMLEAPRAETFGSFQWWFQTSSVPLTPSPGMVRNSRWKRVHSADSRGPSPGPDPEEFWRNSELFFSTSYRVAQVIKISFSFSQTIGYPVLSISVSASLCLPGPPHPPGLSPRWAPASLPSVAPRCASALHFELEAVISGKTPRFLFCFFSKLGDLNFL